MKSELFILDQAYFGEKGTGHRLIGASGSEEIFAAILGATDRPSSPQSDIQWQPFLSGFPHPNGKHYCFSRTFPRSVQGSSRSGFVFTRMLVLENKLAGRLENLTALLSLLADVDDEATGSVSPIELPSVALERPNPFPPDSRMRAAASKLLSNKDAKYPVVWLGQEGFDELITRLWAGLWPQARLALRFRLSFDRSDSENRGLTLVSAPMGKAARWAGFPVVDDKDRSETGSRAESLLAGESFALKEWVSDLGLSAGSVVALKHVDEAYSVLSREKADTVSELIRLLRVLVAVSADPTHGSLYKVNTLRSLVEQFPAALPEQVHSLRNIDPAAFPGGRAALDEAVQKWVANNFVRIPRNVAPWLTYTSSQALEWWKASVVMGVKLSLKAWTPKSATAVWDCLLAAPASVSVVTTMLPKSDETMVGLMKGLPKQIDPQLAGAIADFAHLSHSPSLAAAVLASSLPPLEAFDRFREKTWTESELARGFEVLSRQTTATDLISGALLRDDIWLHELAAKRLAANPELFRGMDPAVPRWRRLWLRSIQLGLPVWEGINRPKAVRDSLLDRSLQYQDVAVDLLEAVVKTPEGSLLNYPRREEVWAALPEPARTHFLDETARSWIVIFRRDPAAPLLENAVLQSVVTNNALLRVDRSSASRDLAVGIAAFERISLLRESDLIGWLNANRGHIAELHLSDAVRLCTLLNKRQWPDAAHQVFATRNKSRALQETVISVRELLGWFQRGELMLESHSGTSFSKADWYEGLFETAVGAFPEGPLQNRIWQRAGGDSSRIKGGSGREQWQSALHLLERGAAGKKITRAKLLATMKDELPRNRQVELLRRTMEEQ